MEAGRRFIETFSAQETSACRYHRAERFSIADESVHIIELGPADANVYVERAEKSRLPEEDRWWLASLFYDPIIIGGGSYTNGQHRACALRFSGAEPSAVVTGDELLGEESADWRYE